MIIGEKKAVIGTTKKIKANTVDNDGIPRRQDMLKQILRFRTPLVSLLILSLFCPAALARADDRGNFRGGDRGYSRFDDRDYHRGSRHYYRDGRWYRHGWFGFGILVSALAIGALIESLPPRHTTVVVEGTPYYHDDNYYYRPLSQGGYVVVPQPVVAPPPVVVSQPVIIQPFPQIPETSTVNIPNSRGGYNSVTLRKSGNGFVGPQGEYYPNYPSVEQLRMMYGN
jgi:hypothetical protein